MSCAVGEDSSAEGRIMIPKQQSPFQTWDMATFLVNIATCSNGQP